MRLTVEEAVERYGEIENAQWTRAAAWCIVLKVPAEISQTWINSATGKPTEHIYVNREVAPALAKALSLVVERGLVAQLKTFDGCFVVRSVRGDSGRLSCHCYACAIDINAAENALGQEPQMTPELVQCFNDAGFAWGGDFTRKDGMHFSLAWE